MSGLSIRGLDAGYGPTPVIREVSLDVAAGEFVGIIGPNGAGKSTMLKAVTGVATVLAGDIALGVDSLPTLDARSRACRVAVVPQTLPEAFAFSAREFVEMGRYPYLGRFDHLGVDDHAAVERAMRHTDMLVMADEAVETLSGGDLQRLTLAQALAQEPDVLLLDEPTSHLDLNHQLQVLDLVRSRVAKGLAVLGIFHDIGLAARYADRLGVISQGALTSVGVPSEVVTSDLLREVFGVRAVVGTDPVTGTVNVTPVLRDDGAVARRTDIVFVLAGSGAGAQIMRDLVQAGYEVKAGALNEGDVDQAVAEALGIEHVKLPAFGEMDDVAGQAVRSMLASSTAVVVSGVPFGRANLANLAEVASVEMPVLLVGGTDGHRDFTGGDAVQLLERITAKGATMLEDAGDVLSAVEALADA